MSIVLNGANEAGIGEVLDGEHRLESVIQSGIPQIFVVVSGVESRCLRHLRHLQQEALNERSPLCSRTEKTPRCLPTRCLGLLPRVDPAKAAEARR